MITFPPEFVDEILAGKITIVTLPKHKTSPNLYSFHLAKPYSSRGISFAGLRVLDKYESRVRDIPEEIIARSGYKPGEMDKFLKHLCHRLKFRMEGNEYPPDFMKAVVVIILFEVEGKIGVFANHNQTKPFKTLQYTERKEIKSYEGTNAILKPIPCDEFAYIKQGVRNIDVGEMRGRPYITIEDES